MGTDTKTLMKLAKHVLRDAQDLAEMEGDHYETWRSDANNTGAP